MFNLIDLAVNNESNKEFTFFLEGDLNQMSTQRQFLNNRGIITKQNNVYPCLKEEDVPKALKLILVNRIEGWWHYKDKYIKHNLCTEEELKTYFNY